MRRETRRIRARVALVPFVGKGGKPSVDRILTPVPSRSLRGFLLALAVLPLLTPSVAGGQDSGSRVLAVHLDNDINPVTQEYVENAVDRAEREELAAVVLVLDTPGGLSSSMRGIVKRFLASRVPVVVYVAPPGSSADSAGAVIAMAADVAAMAPQTNIGSSTPISLGGEDISKDLRRKVVNDAAAYVGELAREHDRNVTAARNMVTEASNYGAREAKAIGLVEVIAPTLPALLEEIDGRKTVPKGLVLDTAGAQIEDVEMSFWQRARDFLVDPNLIALMLSIGLIGIVVELWNPGLIFPGTVGAISLGGEDISKDLRRKIVNDAAAYVGELAREHDRNVPAARKMVTEAANYGARQAEAIGLVEVIAPTLPALLNEMDGMKTVPKGLVLDTAGAQIENVEMSFWQRARDFLVDPNLIALMLSIGLIGIVVELWNPGLIFPGTVGVISLILGLYGLQVLPVSAAGLLLMVVAAAFFVADAFVPTHGAITLAGAILFVLGALMLFDPAGDAYQVSLPVAVAIAATLALVLGLALTRVVRAARNPAAVGTQGLVGGEALVRRGNLVSVNGELWRARTADDSPLIPGTHVLVEHVESDLRLVVGSPRPPNEEEEP